jgi:hypothetical protein
MAPSDSMSLDPQTIRGIKDKRFTSSPIQIYSQLLLEIEIRIPNNIEQIKKK